MKKINYDGWIMLNLYAQVTAEPDRLHENENFDNCLHEKILIKLKKY